MAPAYLGRVVAEHIRPHIDSRGLMGAQMQTSEPTTALKALLVSTDPSGY